MQSNYFASITLLFALTLSSITQAQDFAPVDADSILKELQLLRTARKQQFESGLQKVVAEISAAAASDRTALEFYETTIRAVDFEGLKSDGSQFRAWREKEKDNLDRKEFQKGIRLHLQWIAISLRRVQGQQDAEMIPSILAHINDTLEEPEAKGNGNLAAVDIQNGPFSRFYQLEAYLTELKDWEMKAGSTDSILDKTVMPFYRETKDVRILEVWEDRLVRAEKRASERKLAAALEQFNTERKPQLLWSRAKDLMVIGQKNRAITEMLGLIKAHSSHPNFDRWAQELEAALQE